MLNTDGSKLDFEQRFAIMHGTGFYVTADTLEDVDAWRTSVDDLTRHFNKVGDHKTGQMIDGSMSGQWRNNPDRYQGSWYKW